MTASLMFQAFPVSPSSPRPVKDCGFFVACFTAILVLTMGTNSFIRFLVNKASFVAFFALSGDVRMNLEKAVSRERRGEKSIACIVQVVTERVKNKSTLSFCFYWYLCVLARSNEVFRIILLSCVAPLPCPCTPTRYSAGRGGCPCDIG